MTTTENYGLKIAEGGDIVNPLVIDNPNYATIDEVMKDNADNGIPKATELTTGTVHALTRSNPDASVFHFTATSNYATGDTFTVDNLQVTALLPSGLPLATGAYIIGSEVICALRDTLLTVFVNAGTALIAEDSEKLGGELPAYYATQSDMDSAENSIDALSLLSNALDLRVTALEQGGSGLIAEDLWTNPNSISLTFGAQNITLSKDINQYRFMEVVYVRSNSRYYEGHSTGLIDTVLEGFELEGATPTVCTRSIRKTTGTVLAVGDAYNYASYGASGTINNAQLIPYKVIGFK